MILCSRQIRKGTEGVGQLQAQLAAAQAQQRDAEERAQQARGARGAGERGVGGASGAVLCVFGSVSLLVLLAEVLSSRGFDSVKGVVDSKIVPPWATLRAGARLRGSPGRHRCQKRQICWRFGV